MRLFSSVSISPLVGLLTLLVHQPTSWQDPSPHQVHLVKVQENVRLEVLDWGGSGRPVVLLAGGGNTAHVFDDFAPKLTDSFHVYGITRRGFGASGFAAAERAGDRLGQDVVAVLNALKLNAPVLVGHSIAGAELSSVATSDPDRVAGLVYLEAGYPYAFDNGKGPTMKEFLDARGPSFPTPRRADLVAFSALREWDARVFGFRTPEAEFRQIWDSTSDGRPLKAREFPGSSAFMTIMTSGRKYASLRVPALVIFALPHVQEAWLTESSDPAVRQAADAYFRTIDTVAERQAKAVEEGLPNARVVRLRGMHYVYMTNEAEVLREIRAFNASLTLR
jgi:pimeloyl-ACP methyl ester carboxylesterase